MDVQQVGSPQTLHVMVKQTKKEKKDIIGMSCIWQPEGNLRRIKMKA